MFILYYLSSYWKHPIYSLSVRWVFPCIKRNYIIYC